MNIDTQTPVAAIARRHPETIKVFQRRRIDFCCGGKHPLGEACAEQGLVTDEVLAELIAVADHETGGETDWSRQPTSALVAHILQRYHEKLRLDLPVLRGLATKVAHRHGNDVPALLAVREVIEDLAVEMGSHMEREEKLLFPLLLRLGADGASAAANPLAGPIQVMEHEHEEVASMLATLRALTGEYLPPRSACNSFRGLYAMLAELEGDTFVHIHLENNVLFPRAAELSQEAPLAV